MKTVDLELICEFLEEYGHDFGEFLASKEMEPTGAPAIIDSIKEEISDRKEHN